MVLYPYKDTYGTWVFDDQSVGLVREAFVLGADTIMSALSKQVNKGKDKQFKLIFSRDKFPTYQYEFQHLRSDSGGNWYGNKDLGLEGWLCPALFHYFDKAPKSIFVKAEKL